MREGTICTRIRIVDWEKQPLQDLFNYPYGDSIIKISIEPVCHLKVKILEGVKEVWTFVSQKLHFEGNGSAVLYILWDQSGVRLLINMINVNDCKHAETLHIPIIDENIIESNIYERNNIYEKCADWMEWRIKRYSSSKIKSNRIAKTIEEQFIELDNCIKSLREFYDAIFNQHKKYLLPSLYSLLRSLLLWVDDPNNKNYNPLLLRLATFLRLPLPVYAMPSSMHKLEKNQGLFSKLSFILENPMASTRFQIKGQCIMDIQEWLNGCIYNNRGNGSLEYKLKDLVCESANIWGSHSDEGIPIVLDNLKKMKVISDELVLNILKNVTEITIDSGLFVLRVYSFMKQLNELIEKFHKQNVSVAGITSILFHLGYVANYDDMRDKVLSTVNAL